MIEKDVIAARDAFEPTGASEALIDTRARGGFLALLGLGGIPNRAWKVTLLSLGGLLLVSADGSLFNFTYPLLQKDLGITDNEIGAIYTILFAVGAISSFIAGPMMDRIGRKPVYQACLFAAAFGSVLTAVVPGFLVLIIARSITQIGASTEWMSGQVMVAEEAPAKVRGRLIGLSQVGYPLGYFVGALLSMAIVDHFGWRVLFVCGLLPIILMIFARRGVEDTARFQEEMKVEKAHTELRRNHFAQLFEGDLRRSSICLLIWHFTYAFGAAGIISYLPTVYGHFNISLNNMFASSAIATGLAAFGYILAAWLGEKYGRREVCAAFLVLGAIAGALLAFYANTWALLTVFYALFYFFTLGHITSAVGFAAEVYPTRVRGTGSNLVAGAEWTGFVIAAMTGPWLLHNAGYTTALMMWCVIGPLVAAVAAMCMKRIAPQTVLEEIHR
ncbi:MFS transporter [Paraburkholderia sp. A2RI-6]|uniref:MFS transporter n=1 Tax=Paraburkholderia sp. A2RI-6 TaxID=3028371 RepID=UPI003B7D8EF3